MKLRLAQYAPVLISGACLLVAAAIHLRISFLPDSADSDPISDFVRRLEWITYDWRVRSAAKFPQVISSNLAGVFITNEDIDALNDGRFEYREKFPWPVYIYGKVIRELRGQGAQAVGMDILLDQLNPAAKTQPDGVQGSDDQFTEALKHAGNVFLAADPTAGIYPAASFESSAAGVADVSTIRDADGVLRRVKAFHKRRVWHPWIQSLDRAFRFDYESVQFGPGTITLPGKSGDPLIIPLTADGFIDQEEAAFVDTPSGRPERPYSDKLVWNLGIVLAAIELKLDLKNPILRENSIILQSSSGIEREIAVNSDGEFYIDWSVPWENTNYFQKANVASLVRAQDLRTPGERPDTVFKNKLVVIGSAATGNNVTDMGATPLAYQAILVSKHWNIANSLLTGRFILKTSPFVVLLIILLLGTLSALLTWRLQPVPALSLVALLAAGYAGIGVLLYGVSRHWLPMVMPLAGGLLLPHFALVTYQVVFEQRERRRIRAVFGSIIAPEVVNELLSVEQLSLGGARKVLTVLFSDIRGFTEFTDSSQAAAEEYVRTHDLCGPEAEAWLAEQAREALATVNLYLGIVANTIKRHRGTLDKYIGDCVMAFWGAPVANQTHAIACVRAAIEAQRAIDTLNQERRAENSRRNQENERRLSEGVTQLPLLPLLSLGTGINTGAMTVGLMGSREHLLNYTVFGREVNLACRLESISGRARIIVSEATHREIAIHDPDLARSCVELPPVQVKGIRLPVRNFEVPWRVTPPGDQGQLDAKVTETVSASSRISDAQGRLD